MSPGCYRVVMAGSDRSPKARAARAAEGFTTYREGSLHAALKDHYAGLATGSRVEAVVDGFVVDVVGPDELIEIQTRGFAGLRRKLEQLVETRRVVVVHPMALEKWLVVIDAEAAIIRRRRSPRRALPLDLFDELVSIPALLTHPNFRIELLLTCEEEIRGPVPVGARFRYPREWWRLDRRLVEIVETYRIDGPAELAALLPSGLPDVFTTADIVVATGRSKRLAMRAVYCLERCGAIARAGRQGRHVAYRRTAPEPSVAASSPALGTAVGLAEAAG